MQSNGGVISPQLARKKAALTLLSGPAGGPAAGLFFARALDSDRCITTDMGGTSFEASAVVGTPATVNDGEIARHKIALPMLDIHTIGAGGGSIGWLDEGGLLRMGPQSAGAAPGPACYGKGGRLPTTTDANLVLGYLDPGISPAARCGSIAGGAAGDRRHIAKPMGLTIEEAAAGHVSRRLQQHGAGRARGNDQARLRSARILFHRRRRRRADPFVPDLLGAGNPIAVVPPSSSVLCAFGMLLSDLRHDFVRTFVARLAMLDWSRTRLRPSRDARTRATICWRKSGSPGRIGATAFASTAVTSSNITKFRLIVPARRSKTRSREIARAFHAEHNRNYGYTLETEKTPIEIINVRLQAIGATEKAELYQRAYSDADAKHALKGKRTIYLPESAKFEAVPRSTMATAALR